MKNIYKIISITLAVLMVLSFAGCAKKEKGSFDANGEITLTVDENSQIVDAKTGEVVDDKNLEVDDKGNIVNKETGSTVATQSEVSENKEKMTSNVSKADTSSKNTASNKTTSTTSKTGTVSKPSNTGTTSSKASGGTTSKPSTGNTTSKTSGGTTSKPSGGTTSNPSGGGTTSKPSGGGNSSTSSTTSTKSTSSGGGHWSDGWADEIHEQIGYARCPVCNAELINWPSTICPNCGHDADDRGNCPVCGRKLGSKSGMCDGGISLFTGEWECFIVD